MKIISYCLAVLLSAGLLTAAERHWIPSSLTEAFGFVTGAWCVWLTVRENIWNWPIGIANSTFFIVLFLQSRLYADMGLQVIYVVLGLLGWYWWLYGGQNRTTLHVARISVTVGLVLTGLMLAATAGGTIYLTRIHDSAPFLDSLTTALSLAAQYMLTKKLIENWYVWITADIIYIGLYLYKHLYLTSALYVLFACLCVIGLREWRRSIRNVAPPLDVLHG
jgi:nicotinamide mononucleotide transporter